MSEETKYIVIASTIVLLVMIVVLVFIYSYFIQKKTDFLIEQQEKELEFEKELSESLNEIKEQTLRNIGLELHDNIGQKLSVARLRTYQLNSKLCSDNKEELTEISELLRETIQDIRTLSKTLIVNELDEFDLNYYLLLEFERFKKLEHIIFDVKYLVDNNIFQIRPKHALIIFRMVQETLNNVYKHSHAKHVYAVVLEKPNHYFFSIKDDGVGFDIEAINFGKGLLNLKERAALINANYSIQSAPNEGCTTNIKYYKYVTY